MTRAISAIVIFVTIFTAGIARAQEYYWIQVAANATLREAKDTARVYAARVEDVNGFRLSDSGWYAVALGPYGKDVAEERLIALRRAGRIPGDAFVADSTGFATQFWPVGTDLLNAPATPGTGAAETQPELVVIEPAPDPVMLEPDETRQEALRSERDLDGEQRKQLQVALQWEGFYKSLIDGDFGPGTRGAMAAWQDANGYDPTGVLTTRQRTTLMKRYNDMLASLGLAQITDAEAGIEIILPMAMVNFTRYEAPFAHYEGNTGVRVVLISQRGDKATLYGLYDILQTLNVVPVEGARSRRDGEFTIHGENAEIVTDIYATLKDGAVKGYMLIWPQGRMISDIETGESSYETDKRRSMVLDAMRSSFASTGEMALDDNAGLDTATQSIDLISGLEIRRAEKARSGFFVSGDGAVLTTIEAVTGCERVTLDDSYAATVAATDASLGLALLKPEEKLAPVAVAEMLSFEPRLKSELAVAGYSFGGRLPAPTLTFGTLADLKGLQGEAEIARLEISAQDGDTGGPVVDQNGAVLGMLLATPSGDGRLLPADVGFAAKAGALVDFLEANGITATATEAGHATTPYALSQQATGMTVLVSCWK